MKKIIFLLLISAVTITSCRKLNPDYTYESKPVFGWGYAEFWGDYFKKYNIKQNVISLSLFSDSLKLNTQMSLTGYGQYLYLEDIFIPATDTILPEGDYTVSKSGETFTITPGSKLTIDANDYFTGAQLYYFEKQTIYSVRRFVTGGTMNVSHLGSKHYITCDFTLDDNTQIKGTYNNVLVHFDFSSINTTDSSESLLKVGPMQLPSRSRLKLPAVINSSDYPKD